MKIIIRYGAFTGICSQVGVNEFTLEDAKMILADLNNVLIYIEHNCSLWENR